MYRIAKTYEFSASHQILTLPEDHKCRRLHGHNYKAEFIAEANTLNENGMVRDYGDFGDAKTTVAAIDHRHLNDLMSGPPTAEHLAALLFGWVKSSLPELVAVRVSEGDHSWAEYSE